MTLLSAIILSIKINSRWIWIWGGFCFCCIIFDLL
jgi:hypothetical protein